MYFSLFALNNLCKRRSQVPTSNRYRLVFPFNSQTLTFNTQFYNPLMTDNRVQISQLESFFEEIYETCDRFSLLRSWMDSFYVLIYFVILILVFIIHFLDQMFEAFATLFFLLGLILLMGVIFINIIKGNKIVEQYQNKVLGIINYSNKTLYEILGLKWNISSKGFDWVELQLDYRIDKEYTKYMEQISQDKKSYLGGRFQTNFPVVCCEKVDFGKQEIPPSTETCLIFPFNYQTFQYNSSFYHTSLTEKRLQKELLNNFLGNLSENFTRARNSKFAKIMSYIQIIIPLFSCLWVIELFQQSRYGRVMLCLLVCIMIIHLIQMLKHYKTTKLFREERANIKDQIEKFNQKIRTLELRWTLSPSNVDWLELWLDYKFIDQETSIINKEIILNPQTEENIKIENEEFKGLLDPPATKIEDIY